LFWFNARVFTTPQAKDLYRRMSAKIEVNYEHFLFMALRIGYRDV